MKFINTALIQNCPKRERNKEYEVYKGRKKLDFI